MIGAIAGDIIGSIYEWHNIKTKSFPLFQPESRFTDDSVLTCAVARAIMNGGIHEDYLTSIRTIGRMYPNCGYGGHFIDWLKSDSAEPYNSWGNGSAMRVSPVIWAYDSLEEVLRAAKVSSEVTHNHPDGIKGAQAIASAGFLARTGYAKSEIKNYISSQFGYDLDRTLDEIRPVYGFEVSCPGSVPEAIIAFLESNLNRRRQRHDSGNDRRVGRGGIRRAVHNPPRSDEQAALHIKGHSRGIRKQVSGPCVKYMPILRRSLFQKRETPLLLIRSSAHLPRRVAGCVDCGTEGVFVQRYLGEDHRLAPGMGRSDLYNGEIPPNCSYKRLLRTTPPAAHRRSCFGA